MPVALATQHHRHIHQMDIQNAFLHGDLHEEVNILLPPSLDSHIKLLHTNKIVCHFHKLLYGLKHESLMWFVQLHFVLRWLGFTQAKLDSTLFFQLNPKDMIIIKACDDDLPITRDNLPSIITLQEKLSDYFSIKDLAQLKYFLDLEFSRSLASMFVTQWKYALDLLRLTNYLDVKMISTPTCLYLTDANGNVDIPRDDPFTYCWIVGKLVYLTITRLNITHDVNNLSQHMATSTNEDLQAARHVLCYIRGSSGFSLSFGSSSMTSRLRAFFDSDWESCPLTLRLTMGFSIYLCSALISWQSKKQHTVSRSLAETEYHALAYTTCEIAWLTHLLLELGI